MTIADGIVPVSTAATAALLKRSIPDDLPPQMWPDRDPGIAADPDVRDLRDRLDETLTHGDGYAIVRMESLVDRPSDLVSAFWNLFVSLGQPLPQYSTGERSFQVRDEGAAPTRNHYSATNRGGGYHTDGTFLPETPFYVGLMCVRQSLYGGDSVLIDIRKLHRELQQNYPHVLQALERSYHFDCCGQFPEVQTRHQPILSQRDGQPFVRYLRGYINTGHEKLGIPLEEETIAALDTFDALLDRDEFQWTYKLHPGDMLVFNNTIMLHGRKAFADDKDNKMRSRRLMVRVYARQY